GLEVWTMIYEGEEGTYFADCRPAFRNRQVYQFYPWEIVEYELDGEALLTGMLQDGEDRSVELVFALQNLTELNLRELPWRELTAAVSGLAYKARVFRQSRRSRTRTINPGLSVGEASENDYSIFAPIVAWRQLQNQHTTSDLIWIQLDLGRLNLEVVVNRADLVGMPRAGDWLSAEIWLQGYILDEKQVESRFEGIDRRITRHQHWQLLQRRHGL
ncbi:MAG: DUF3881 family protein, partial [Acidobacteria bacterium]|nr:DUF3881 family protein [Acidobacteriota bacterium]